MTSPLRELVLGKALHYNIKVFSGELNKSFWAADPDKRHVFVGDLSKSYDAAVALHELGHIITKDRVPWSRIAYWHDPNARMTAEALAWQWAFDVCPDQDIVREVMQEGMTGHRRGLEKRLVRGWIFQK